MWDLVVGRPWDLQELARYLRDQVEPRGNGIWFAALYDPVSYVESDCWEAEDWATCVDAERAVAAEATEAEIRPQVDDLVEWLDERGGEHRVELQITG